jgi:general secretion pathway protein G
MKRPRPSGFTLIEMLAAVTLLALLAASAAPLIEASARRMKESELRAALRTVREAVDAYKDATDAGRIERKADETGYPRTLAELVDGVIDAKDPKKGRIRFLRRIPRDPFAEDAAAAPMEQWGLRSYASSHNAPAPGADVYDVYSLSTRVGSNGVPYREW